MMIMELRQRDDSKATTSTRPPDAAIHPNSKETLSDGSWFSANNRLRCRVPESEFSTAIKARVFLPFPEWDNNEGLMVIRAFVHLLKVGRQSFAAKQGW